MVLTDEKIIKKNGNALYYDGGCPVCNYYVEFSAIKDQYPDISLINGRDNDEVLSIFRKYNFNLNDGMLLIFSNRIYYAEDCVHMLTNLSRKKNVIYYINKIFFSSVIGSKIFYPVFKMGRKILLSLLGREPL